MKGPSPKARAACALAMVALLTACDFPTNAPNWDMTWNVPAKNASIGASSFLPAGVTPTANGSAFQFNVATIANTRTLGTDCPPCATANGLTVPKPAFTSTASGSAALPAGVSTATLSGDTLTVTIQNAFNFDPIRPALPVTAANAGTLTITATSGSVTVGSTTLNGTTSSIPSGAATTVKVPLAGTLSSTTGLQLSATLNSPQGDPVRINSALQMAYTARAGSTTQGTVVMSSGTVVLTNRSFSSTPTDLNLDIGNDTRDHVEAGSLFLTITNPFAVTGPLTLNVTGGPTPVTKPVTLQRGTFSVRIDFSQPEIRSLLAAHQLNFNGTVTGTTQVAPDQNVAVSSRIQLTVSTTSKP